MSLDPSTYENIHLRKLEKEEKHLANHVNSGHFTPVGWVIKGDEVLVSYKGIIINHYTSTFKGVPNGSVTGCQFTIP